MWPSDVFFIYNAVFLTSLLVENIIFDWVEATHIHTRGKVVSLLLILFFIFTYLFILLYFIYYHFEWAGREADP